MENFKKYLWAFIALFTLGFVACSDDTDVEEEDTQVSETTISITSTPVTAVERKKSYYYMITTKAVNPDGPIVITATGVPEWATFSDAGNGMAEIEGVAPASASTSDIVIRATNNGAEDIQSFKLNVSYTPKPTVVSIVPVSVPVLLPSGYAFNYTIRTTVEEADGDTQIKAEKLPSWLTLKDNGDGTALLSGTTPKVSAVQTDEIEIAATNNNIVAKQNFSLKIKETVKVACVGNSITFGSMLSNRVKDCYPAQLSNMLGEGFDVGNFGKSGATMLRNGDRPYVKQAEYTKAIDFEPDIVVIKLGTNDTKPMNWDGHKGEFKDDTNYLIEQFEKLSSTQAVFMCTPCKVFNGGNYGITDEVVSGGVIPVLKEVVKERNMELIDIYTVVSGHSECFQKDGVHPDADGAKLIAEEICRVLLGK